MNTTYRDFEITYSEWIGLWIGRADGFDPISDGQLGGLKEKIDAAIKKADAKPKIKPIPCLRVIAPTPLPLEGVTVTSFGDEGGVWVTYTGESVNTIWVRKKGERAKTGTDWIVLDTPENRAIIAQIADHITEARALYKTLTSLPTPEEP